MKMQTGIVQNPFLHVRNIFFGKTYIDDRHEYEIGNQKKIRLETKFVDGKQWIEGNMKIGNMNSKQCRLET